MKWSHLPLEGGIYDQHPKLLDQWRYIFAERNKHEAEKERQRESERKRQSAQAKSRRPGASRPR